MRNIKYVLFIVAVAAPLAAVHAETRVYRAKASQELRAILEDAGVKAQAAADGKTELVAIQIDCVERPHPMLGGPRGTPEYVVTCSLQDEANPGLALPVRTGRRALFGFSDHPDDLWELLGKSAASKRTYDSRYHATEYRHAERLACDDDHCALTISAQ